MLLRHWLAALAAELRALRVFRAAVTAEFGFIPADRRG